MEWLEINKNLLTTVFIRPQQMFSLTFVTYMFNINILDTKPIK